MRAVAAEQQAVVLDQVSRSFGSIVALREVSLSVARGSIVGIIGPSGAGKTTAIRIITGSLSPDQGVVRVLGEDPRRFRRRTRERIGYMPQLFVLYPELTARENVEFTAAVYGMTPWHRAGRVDDVLTFVGLEDARNRRASDLSGGMQRRLELACALVHEPALLILDEPTAGIDPLLRSKVWDELERLRTNGVTVLLTTQYVGEAEYCDRVALISDGELLAYAEPGELRRQALGGEVIELGTALPFDAGTLPAIDGVSAVRQSSPRQLFVIAENAGLATPLVVDAVEHLGGTVEYSRERRPNFDEVFTTLVTAHKDGRRPDRATSDLLARVGRFR